MSEEKRWRERKNVSIPTVWSRYESSIPMKNGKTPKFRIQDLTEEWTDQMVGLMCRFFIRDEPLTKYLDVINDSEAMKEYENGLRQMLKESLVLIAVVENLEELGDENLPALAGCNLMGVKSVGDKPRTTNSEKRKKIFKAMKTLFELGNPFRRYNVTEFLNGYGLVVHPLFREHNLALEILKARFLLCKALGLKATVTAFTAGASQRAAEKAGFETLLEIDYADYKDEKGEVVFKLDTPKSMKLMGYRII